MSEGYGVCAACGFRVAIIVQPLSVAEGFEGARRWPERCLAKWDRAWLRWLSGLNGYGDSDLVGWLPLVPPPKGAA